MLTKATAKLIQSLKDKRQRQASGLFVIEGAKTVAELPASKITVKSLFATREWIQQNEKGLFSTTDIIEISETQLKQISFLSTPQQVLALAYLPQYNIENVVEQDKVIVLDTIQDPGNLGTIIRIADWYGIKHIVCSLSSADVFNPKVIQATMGSFARVEVHYTDLREWLAAYPKPVMGALLEGESIHTTPLPQEGALLIGNEGAGISDTLLPFISKPVTIPRFGEAESLNAGVATAIICDAWLRSLS